MCSSDLGDSALALNINGARNIAIGNSALGAFNPLTDVDTYNVAIGYDAGAVLTVGANNTLIGGYRKSTRLNSSHRCISYAVFCLKKKKRTNKIQTQIDTAGHTVRH